jgi:hypothetical protein
MTVTIRDYREDVCMWCDRKGEGVECDFGTLKGFLCRADFWRKLRANGERKVKATQQKPAPPEK